MNILVDELDEQTQAIREATPDPVTEDEGIAPPWEREGYDSKQAWLDSK